MYSDVQCQKSFKLFKEFNDPLVKSNSIESNYSACYAHSVIEQFSFAENMKNAKVYKKNYEDECIEAINEEPDQNEKDLNAR